MSFKKSNSKIKSFVTEDEAKDINEKRQQEWEKVRQPEDPLQCPEVEPRSLFEQLQEQKEKAQQEHDEKFNIKNMFRGIDNDEAQFLEFASKQQAEIDRRRFAVTAEVKEYRNEVAELQKIDTPPQLTEEKKKPTTNVLLGKKKSQVELLAGCIKTKRRRSEADNGEEEKSEEKIKNNADKTDSVASEVKDEGEKSCKEDKEEGSSLLTSQPNAEPPILDSSTYGNVAVVNQIGFIPSIGVYSDSSDSESSSSDSDILPTLFSFSSKPKQN